MQVDAVAKYFLLNVNKEEEVTAVAKHFGLKVDAGRWVFRVHGYGDKN